MNATTEWYSSTTINQNCRIITEATETLPSKMYYISGTEVDILFDTGLGVGDLKGLLAEVIDSERPTRVILSHFHWDHLGNAHQFGDVLIHPQERRDDGTVTIDVLSDEFVERPQQFVTNHREQGKSFPDGFDSDDFDVPPANPVSPVDPDEAISLGDRELDIIEIPGHSPGQIAILDEREQILFGADIIHIEKNAYLHFQDSSLDDYIRSLEQVIDLYERDCFDTLLTAHNPPITGNDLDVLYSLEDALTSIANGEREGERIETDWGDALKYEVGESDILTKPDKP